MWWIIAAAAATISIIAAAAAGNEEKRVNIVVIGPRGVGKTTLATFLTTHKLPISYEQTVQQERYEVSLNESKVIILDLPGGKGEYGGWEEGCKNADFIFYLVRSDKILSDDENTISRVTSDITRFKSWNIFEQNKPHLVIIGTFLDMHPDYSKITPSNFGEYIDRFKEKDIIKRIMNIAITKGLKFSVVIGSLKSETDAQKLRSFLLNIIGIKK